MSRETLDIKPAKVYSGSAVYDAFGGCIFTPYDSNPEQNSPWTVLCTTPNGKIACTKKKINLSITFDRTEPSVLIAKFNRTVGALLTMFVKTKVIKLYKECANGKKEAQQTATENAEEAGAEIADEAEELAKQEEERPFGYDVTNT